MTLKINAFYKAGIRTDDACNICSSINCFGHSPAINVWVDFRVLAPAIGIDPSFDPPVKVQAQICSEAKKRPANTFGQVIFWRHTSSKK